MVSAGLFGARISRTPKQNRSNICLACHGKQDNKRQIQSASKNEGTTTNTDVPKQHHPTFYALIVEAITNQKQLRGCSRRSILKYIFANNKLKEGRQNKISLTETIQRRINSESLVHVGNTSNLLEQLASQKIEKTQRQIKRIANFASLGKETTETT